MGNSMSMFSSLSRQKKEAVGLLQIGTFLEYFDLMLYVHMAVLLNELFFPKTDPHTAALLTALAFCSTYVLRPFGALVFGYIGDNIGRKTTVIITTMMMAVSCVVMANLPTYAQIGIAATWVVTVCRIVQGLSSMGEIIGAQIYVSEITNPPTSYPAISFLSVAASIGGFAALGVATLTTRIGFDWRIAFWIGACIAVVGSVARTRLRETPDFVDMKRKLKASIEECKKINTRMEEKLLKKVSVFRKDKISKKTFLSYFLVECGSPISFFLIYIYFNITLKSFYGYSPQDIIFHNFMLAIIQVIQTLVWAIASYHFCPLMLLRIKGTICLLLLLFVPVCSSCNVGVSYVFLLQAFLLMFNLDAVPAEYCFIKQFPVYKRFTVCSVAYALGRAVSYVMIAVGMIYMTKWLGSYGVWLIVLPITIGVLWGVNHFEKLENQKHHQVHTPHPLSIKPDELKLTG